MNNIEESLKGLPQDMIEHAKKGDMELLLVLINTGAKTLNLFSESTNENFRKMDSALNNLAQAILSVANKLSVIEQRVEKLEIKTNH